MSFWICTSSSIVNVHFYSRLLNFPGGYSRAFISSHFFTMFVENKYTVLRTSCDIEKLCKHALLSTHLMTTLWNDSPCKYVLYNSGTQDVTAVDWASQKSYASDARPIKSPDSASISVSSMTSKQQRMRPRQSLTVSPNNTLHILLLSMASLTGDQCFVPTYTTWAKAADKVLSVPIGGLAWGIDWQDRSSETRIWRIRGKEPRSRRYPRRHWIRGETDLYRCHHGEKGACE